jgi:hypothetical protein
MEDQAIAERQVLGIEHDYVRVLMNDPAELQ